MLLNCQAARICLVLGVGRSVRRFPPSFCHSSTGCVSLSKAIHSSIFRNDALSAMKAFATDASQTNLYCERLEHRGLIRISGVDTFKFLQGLVTNDVHLLEKFPAIYAMMLNVQGRVMDDLIIYGTPGSDSTTSVIVECDRDRCSELISTLSRFKLRNKIQVINVADELDCWSLYSDSTTQIPPSEVFLDSSSHHVVKYATDPRLSLLGSRLLLHRGINATSLISGSVISVNNSYRSHLCRNGVGEGTVDFPPGHCFPLESNLAFLNGVSFDKGCYIGQELTARTHHTGVIRKRIMPLVLSNSSQQVKPGASIVNGAGKVCGKVRSVCGSDALGLLRVADVLGNGVLSVKIEETVVAEARTHMPSWWPSGIDAVVQQAISKESN